MIWWSLGIPIVMSILFWILFQKKITVFELFLPITISAIAVVASYYTMKSVTLSDQEYNGYTVVSARYFESYETWVKKTCSNTICSGTGKTRTCTTYYYDCSYCDYNPEHWEMYDTKGNSISIDKAYYNYLKSKWKSKQQFVELNRDIDYHGGCGKDGDAYDIKWNGRAISAELTTYEKSFTNILKSNHSAFNYPVIEDEEAIKIGLYTYPTIDGYNQKTVLGLKGHTDFKKYMEFINGYYGSRYKVRIYTLFFVDKPIDIAFKQEAYWDGGNQNEIVVCVGLKRSGDIEWVKPFSWCDNKRVIVDIREDIMKTKKVDKYIFYKSYLNAIKNDWHYKKFEDFNYLSFEPTTGQLIFVYVFVTLLSIGINIWNINNEFDYE